MKKNKIRFAIVSIVVLFTLNVHSSESDCSATLDKSEKNLSDFVTAVSCLSDQIKQIANPEKSISELKKICPKGMKDAGTYCIDTSIRFPRGRNWLDNNQGCIKKGLRICSTAEISGAVRLGYIKTYKFAEGDYWYWSSDVSLNSTDDGGGKFDACHVEINTDQPSFVLGEWNCQLNGDTNHPSVGGICCK